MAAFPHAALTHFQSFLIADLLTQTLVSQLMRRSKWENARRRIMYRIQQMKNEQQKAINTAHHNNYNFRLIFFLIPTVIMTTGSTQSELIDDTKMCNYDR